MLFGAIDVGTNSIHLIVVEFDSTFDTTRVVYKDREMVRLGSNDAMEHGRLSAKAMAEIAKTLSQTPNVFPLVESMAIGMYLDRDDRFHCDYE